MVMVLAAFGRQTFHGSAICRRVSNSTNSMFCRLSPSGTYNIQFFHTAIPVLVPQSLSSRRNLVQMSGFHRYC